ncbi:MAG: winged helix-turn-helix transcriptional regulator [Candidatus Methanofastidiosia archaeon]
MHTHDFVEREIEEFLEYSKRISEKLMEIEHSEEEMNNELNIIVKVMNIFSQKWTIEIIYLLKKKGKMRFNEIKKFLKGISSRTLTDKLTILVKNGYVERKVFDEVPVRVEYSLTEEGKNLAYASLPLILYLKRRFLY